MKLKCIVTALLGLCISAWMIYAQAPDLKSNTPAANTPAMGSGEKETAAPQKTQHMPESFEGWILVEEDPFIDDLLPHGFEPIPAPPMGFVPPPLAPPVDWEEFTETRKGKGPQGKEGFFAKLWVWFPKITGGPEAEQAPKTTVGPRAQVRAYTDEFGNRVETTTYSKGGISYSISESYSTSR